MANITGTTTQDTSIHSIQHIEITASEPENLKDFMGKVFGWKFETFPMQADQVYHMFRTPNGSGGGVMAPQPGQPIAATPYINVENVEKALKACQSAGAKIVMPVTEVPGQGRFFWFQYAGGPPLACWQATGKPQ